MYEDFKEWLDNILKNGLPEGGAAVNFNIYEEGENRWSLQFILASEYDNQDDDWACEEIFSSEEDIFEFELEGPWEQAQEKAIELIREYLQNGSKKDLLNGYTAVCTGFVDGALMRVGPLKD
ncbi:MAG: hypothetical protein J5685_11335 [Clostridiales bacterium]|nr:hypothetical protein [Clostridiales bacterium]